MKTIVITGASRGIGLATAKKFLAEGWQVVGTYLHTPIPIQDQNLKAIQYDQSDPQSVVTVTEQIKSLTPHVDALINNAGIILDALDTSVEIEKIRKTLETDLLGVIDLTERLTPTMGSGSHIINIDSLYGSFSFPIDDKTSTGYRIAKAGLNMYTRTLAFRLNDSGIIVSSLDPGWVKTNMGQIAATETEGPDRDPSEPAEDIYNIVSTVKETGCFWKLGQKRDW